MSVAVQSIDLVVTDGGRAQAGFRSKTARDCVVRAIAIAAELPYADVHKELERRTALFLAKARRTKAQQQREKHIRKGTDAGTYSQVYKPYLAELGFTWTPTMQLGQGTQVHVRADELPAQGRHILRMSTHLSAYVDGAVHDTHDPSRGGTRCVYGYWTSAASGS